MTKFKAQGLYIKRIKYWNASGSGPPPSFIPKLWNIGILQYKQAKRPIHLQHSVRDYLLKQIWIEIRIQFHPNIAFHYHVIVFRLWHIFDCMYLENDFASFFWAQESKYLKYFLKVYIC